MSSTTISCYHPAHWVCGGGGSECPFRALAPRSSGSTTSSNGGKGSRKSIVEMLLNYIVGRCELYTKILYALLIKEQIHK